jgi:hypothetical protein
VQQLAPPALRNPLLAAGFLAAAAAAHNGQPSGSWFDGSRIARAWGGGAQDAAAYPAAGCGQGASPLRLDFSAVWGRLNAQQLMASRSDISQPMMIIAGVCVCVCWAAAGWGWGAELQGRALAKGRACWASNMVPARVRLFLSCTGAGSGKTSTIVSRVAFLLEQVRGLCGECWQDLEHCVCAEPSPVLWSLAHTRTCQQTKFWS